MSDIQTLPSPCGGPTLAELRRYDVGELSAEARVRVGAHTESCARCQAVLRDFAADAAAFRTALPFAALEHRLETRRRSPLVRWWRTIAVGIAVPAAAALGALVIAPRLPHGAEPGSPVTRAKGGGPSLDFVVKSGPRQHDGQDGEALRPGDALDFRYDSKGLPYVLIVGVDADGKVSPYYTAGDRSATAARGAALAPISVVLDGDPRPERIFALYSKDPIGVDEVKPAARDALAAHDHRIEAVSTLPGFSEQASILINKAR